MNENIRRKILAVQEITIAYKKEGLSQKEIYWRYIRDKFYISQSTYQRYLGIRLKDNEYI
jgi:DNA-binding transcriptional regulator YiaG